MISPRNKRFDSLLILIRLPVYSVLFYYSVLFFSLSLSLSLHGLMPRCTNPRHRQLSEQQRRVQVQRQALRVLLAHHGGSGARPAARTKRLASRKKQEEEEEKEEEEEEEMLLASLQSHRRAPQQQETITKRSQIQANAQAQPGQLPAITPSPPNGPQERATSTPPRPPCKICA